jgi:DNA-binding transcriptional ArsR family regulator
MPPSSNHERGQPLPDNVQELLTRRIRTVLALEILLLLHRSPETYWTEAAAAAVIAARPDAVSPHFQALESAGLIARAKDTYSFRYAPREESEQAAIGELAEAWKVRRDDVLRAIVGGMPQITAFSDAFRVR